MKKLSNKESKFLRFILEGKSQIEAYKLTYSVKKKATDNAIRVEACRVFKRDHVQAEYHKAIQKLQDKALYSKEQAIKDLIFLVEMSKKDINKRGINQSGVLGMTKAIEQITAIYGYNYIDMQKVRLEEAKLDFAKSKVAKDNEDLESENRKLLKDLINVRK
ncbi:MAG: hypothetical protein ACRCX8_19615 [Sarcina sp.]